MGSFSAVDIITMERETDDKTVYEKDLENKKTLRASRPKPSATVPCDIIA